MARLVEAYRASKILYNFLISNRITGTFILPSNVCEVVPLTFYLAGINVTFVDIDSKTLCADLNEIERKLNNCSGLLFVRTYGTSSCPIDFFKKIKSTNSNITIIDDCCSCMPILDSKFDESIDLRLFSMCRTKQVNLGGAIGYVSDKLEYSDQTTDYDPEADSSFKITIDNCITNDTPLTNKQYNFLDNKQFIFNEKQFKEKSNESLLRKERTNKIYMNNLPKSIQLDADFQSWRFNIIVNNKKEIIDSLFANNLFASSHFTPKAHIWNDESNGTNSTYLSDHVINLFNDEFYTEEKAKATCIIINSLLK